MANNTHVNYTYARITLIHFEHSASNSTPYAKGPKTLLPQNITEFFNPDG